MTADEFYEKLLSLNANIYLLEFARGKTWAEFYTTCERGDWLLWLFEETNPDDLFVATLAMVHCAKTALHLMSDYAQVVTRAIIAHPASPSPMACYVNAHSVYSLYAAPLRGRRQRRAADICRKYLPIEIWNL